MDIGGGVFAVVASLRRLAGRTKGVVIDTDDIKTSTSPSSRPPSWATTIAAYKRSSLLRSGWQVANTFIPFAALCYAMHVSSAHSYYLTLLLAVPTAGFLIRIFIIQHDCGHHSFFQNRRLNDALGTVCGILTLTPYHCWRRMHARHHTTSGNLGHRGHGDVWTLTTDEYFEQSKRRRLAYRIYRHPAFLFLLGAGYLFLVRQRFTFGLPRTWRRERLSVYATNCGVLAMLSAGSLSVGLTETILIWLPATLIGAAVGSWLFFVQHQFERTYWQPHQTWDFTRAALDGSSYYELPSILQWFTGNIGFHHIHHLNSRIPNYNLAACHYAEPEFRQSTTINLRESLRCASLTLWDKDAQRLVGFAEAHANRERA